MKRLIAVDVETYDPHLLERGDGALRHHDGPDYDGSRLLTCSVWDGERGKSYLPGTSGWEGELVPLLEDESVDKIFHNSVYDLSWLELGYDIDVRGILHDTMTRAAYIDEYQDLGLDACCKKLGLEGKNKDGTIEAWYKNHLEDVRLFCIAQGRPFKRSDALWKHSGFLFDNFPAFREALAEYNLQDCKATYALFKAQEPLMSGMEEAYLSDISLTPLVLRMKREGMLVDRKGLERLSVEVRKDYDACMDELEEWYGIDEEMLSSPKKLGARFNQMGVHSPVKTSTGNESWAQGALQRIAHPAVPLVLEARSYLKLLGTYLEGSLRDAICCDGRVHCTFTPNKRDDGGTITGRFSCSKPNLQQIPAREKAQGHSYGQAMRSLFLPEEGCMVSALDYSQIEYLLLAHFAVGGQGPWLREQACNGVDFHDAAMKMTGIKSRKVVKAFNYGVMYGMGWHTAMTTNWTLFEELSRERGETVEEYTKEVYEGYHKKLPVIRDTSRYYQDLAKRQGYLVTLGGRRLHRPKMKQDPKTGMWNDNLYKMLNKLIQGSAADILKKAMLDIYKCGVLDVATLHLTVHDELVFSIPYDNIGKEANAEIKYLMEESYSDVLSVPMTCDCELGPDWGYWSGDIWEEMKEGIYNRQKDCWWGKA